MISLYLMSKNELYVKVVNNLSYQSKDYVPDWFRVFDT